MISMLPDKCVIMPLVYSVSRCCDMELSCSEVPLYVSSTALGFCLGSCFLLSKG